MVALSCSHIHLAVGAKTEYEDQAMITVDQDGFKALDVWDVRFWLQGWVSTACRWKCFAALDAQLRPQSSELTGSRQRPLSNEPAPLCVRENFEFKPKPKAPGYKEAFKLRQSIWR